MQRVVIEPGSPYDFSSRELEELLEVVANADGEFALELSERDESGYGTSFSEVLNVYMELANAVGATATLVGPPAAVVAWAVRRWRRRSAEIDTSPRPIEVRILGPDGRTLKSVVIDAPDGEPVEVESPDLRHPIPAPWLRDRSTEGDD